MKTKLIIAAIAALTLGSCTQRIADLTIASSKNMDVRVGKYHTATNSRVKGVDKKQVILIVPTGEPDMKEAIDKAIQSAGPRCVGLANVAIYRTSWWIPFIYGQGSFTVEGDPIYTAQ